MGSPEWWDSNADHLKQVHRVMDVFVGAKCADKACGLVSGREASDPGEK